MVWKYDWPALIAPHLHFLVWTGDFHTCSNSAKPLKIRTIVPFLRSGRQLRHKGSGVKGLGFELQLIFDNCGNFVKSIIQTISQFLQL